MRKYELVVLINPSIPKKSFDDTVAQVESLIKDSQKDKDDIGLLDVVTKVKGNDRAYFISYYLEGEFEVDYFDSIKESLNLNKNVLRFNIFKLSKRETFLKFQEVNRAFELSEEEKEKQSNHNAFQDMDSISKRKR